MSTLSHTCSKCCQPMVERQLLISSFYECETCDDSSYEMEERAAIKDENTEKMVLNCTCVLEQTGEWVICDACTAVLGMSL